MANNNTRMRNRFAMRARNARKRGDNSRADEWQKKLDTEVKIKTLCIYIAAHPSSCESEKSNVKPHYR